MSKFTFVHQNLDVYSQEVTTKNTTETNAETLNEVLEEFECFLKGAGYHFEGRLDVVKENEDYDDDDDEDDYNGNDLWDDEDKAEIVSPVSATWPFPTEKGPE